MSGAQKRRDCRPPGATVGLRGRGLKSFFRQMRLISVEWRNSSNSRTRFCHGGLESMSFSPNSWRPNGQERKGRPVISRILSGQRSRTRLNGKDGLGVGWLRILIWRRIWRRKGHRGVHHERGLCQVGFSADNNTPEWTHSPGVAFTDTVRAYR